MLTLISEIRRKITWVLMLVAMGTLASCATDKSSARLVSDPDERHESQLPWNKQESWETGGQFAGMTDRR
jgi:hypothetical protein